MTQTQGILKRPQMDGRRQMRTTFVGIDPCASEVSVFGRPRPSPRKKLDLTRPRAATPMVPPPNDANTAVFRNGLLNMEKRFEAPADWFVSDSQHQVSHINNNNFDESSKDGGSSTINANNSSVSEPIDENDNDDDDDAAAVVRVGRTHDGNDSNAVSSCRPTAGGADDNDDDDNDEYDPANHPEDALKFRNLTEFVTVVRDNYRMWFWAEHPGDGGRNVNVETRMDPKFEKVLVTSNTQDPETERRNREKERCLWLQEDRMRWIRALYEHIKEFRTQAKFYLALVIEARGRDPEYDPEEDEQVVAIRKQMIPWADEVMSNVLLLAGIETQIYADLQKDMPSITM
ncbi:unnamed protein product [Notodromas monacha]|uniref:Uncharacterized protein n=1 Tax=Notodromas monacha TaxID=399045 RepID=A0A7R9BI81_9CRUS|nr:unnamed protein product [Notodromas monacha]CAG0915117.1 unnamed protein product [Notodromas monacha]